MCAENFSCFLDLICYICSKRNSFHICTVISFSLNGRIWVFFLCDCSNWGHSQCRVSMHEHLFSFSTLVLWNYIVAVWKERERCKNNAEEIFFCFVISLAYRRPSLCELKRPCLYICAVYDRNSGQKSCFKMSTATCLQFPYV